MMKRQTIGANVTIAAISITMAMTMTACGTAEGEEMPVATHITIETSINAPTASTVKPGAFETDAEISIYAWTGSSTAVVPVDELTINNAINKYDGTKWKSETLMPWKDEASAHYFIGIHPAKAVTDFTADTYDSISDLLVATNVDGRSATQGNVPLVFDHVMSKLVVKLTFRNQFGGITPTVSSVTTTAINGATVDYLSKTATVAANQASETITMTPTSSNTIYECIAAPQKIYQIEINTAGKTYTYNNTQGFTLEGGKIRTVELFVGSDVVELGDVIINDWANSEDIIGGDAQY